jgi:hypothetical protein
MAVRSADPIRSAFNPTRAASFCINAVTQRWTGHDQTVVHVDNTRDRFDDAGNLSGELPELLSIAGEDLDLDGIRRPRQIADEITKDARELGAQRGFCRSDPFAEIVDDLFGVSRAIGAKLHQEVTRVRLCDRQRQASSRPPRVACNLGSVAQYFFDVSQHPIRLRETGAGPRKIIEHKCPFVLLGQKVAVQPAIQPRTCGNDQDHATREPTQMPQRPARDVLVGDDNPAQNRSTLFEFILSGSAALADQRCAEGGRQRDRQQQRSEQRDDHGERQRSKEDTPERHRGTSVG